MPATITAVVAVASSVVGTLASGSVDETGGGTAGRGAPAGTLWCPASSSSTAGMTRMERAKTIAMSCAHLLC